ncbi:amiloride-sensitive sodium channel subunit beta-2-like isoform X2 [Centruroides vittatus]|uniref:amiloride-sensitive sodium channel subunit beta-2-like isoform X2 n=1 Tax=Centruroides vittatus TaxID=120091 RepID=UPI00350F7E7E
MDRKDSLCLELFSTMMKNSENQFSEENINSERSWSKHAWPTMSCQLEHIENGTKHQRKPSRNGIVNRTVWFTLILICMGFCLFHSIAYLREYFQYPTVLNLQVNTESKLDFPAVTVCNYNRIRSNALDSFCCTSGLLLKASSLCHVLNVTCSQTNNEEASSKRLKTLIGSPPLSASTAFATCPRNRTNNTVLYEGSTMKYFSNAYVSLPLSKKIEMGHQIQKFVHQCRFMGQPCDHLNFTTFHTFLYGNCFTFNSGQNGKDILRATTDGSMSGLHLELNLETDEYIFDLTNNIGARLIIHPSNVKPLPENEGIAITSELETSISIEQVNIHRSKPPYPDNCIDYPNDSEGFLYTRNTCLRDCFQQLSQNKCSCADPTWPLPRNSTSCDLRDVTQVCCLDDVRQLLRNDENICVCPLPCFEIQYKLSVSSTKWNPLKSTVQDIFSNLGGQMGMWLGISLMTLLHYFETILGSMFCKQKKTIHQSPIGINP